ncbi:FadR/GntR family transcriptional regulator [Thalassospira marina]|uniref:GntR family transcriptional regulator n=1 Tax=Thalassospira marina TaxID=2048283 RepID=A0A2N3KUA3_9PROT|nr:FCD domain-containing protein [Thalassospira marina]AUG54210.1 GntR family transcriptional regulator [Thalassospira marina]PKR54128.1 GntR family transcriptional regulator [Thalassospira marina]
MKIADPAWRSGASVACDKIGRAIVAGRFPEHTRLPKEAELAAEFAISRNTLREAMKALAAKSLIEIAPRRGTLVLPRSRWNILDRDVAEWAAQIFINDPGFMNELLAFRRLLEPAAAEAAALHATPDEAADIQAAYQEMERAVEIDELEVWVHVDIEFHKAVFRASHNRFIQSVADSVIHALRTSFLAVSNQPSSYAQNLQNHKILADAIERKDSKAAKLTAEKLIETTADVQRKMLR